uniref:Vacuolar protein sorting-associated protein 72 homolog n=2 Tax=Schistocephalus solidus TaxID=70667 RepID=A0A0V0J650_SCHSO
MLNSVTLTRSRRPGAGSRMARLLNEEEEDEFYTSTYGGFTEEADDVDYESESSVQDSIDSDFVETEDDEEDNSAAGSDDEGEKQRRTKRVVTKSYKEPKARKKETASEKAKTESATATTGRAQASKAKPVSPEKPEEPISEGRQLRASTARSTAETTTAQRSSAANSEVAAIRRKALMAEIAQRKNVPEVRRLTQEELLAEAKITEEINKRSLARYQRLEIERKKNRVQKTVNQLPMIRIHHFAVPSVADQPEVYGAAVNSESGEVELCQMLVDREAKCSRTLVTFTDPASFAAAFPSAVAASRQQQMTGSKQPGRPRKRTRYCPLTGRLARYVDPLTRTPYADLAAFRALRYLYRLHLETGTPAIDLLRQYRTGQLRIPEA